MIKKWLFMSMNNLPFVTMYPNLKTVSPEQKLRKGTTNAPFGTLHDRPNSAEFESQSRYLSLITQNPKVTRIIPEALSSLPID